MPFQRVPLTVQVDVIFELYAQLIENVYFVQVPGGIDAAVLVDTANEMGSWVEEHFLGPLSTQITFVRLEVKNLDIDAGGVAVYTPAPNTHGGTSSDSEPGNVAFCVSLRTAQTGRSYRGRKFIAGLPQNGRVGNQMDPTWISGALAAMNELLAFLVSLDKVLVVVSRIQDGLELIEAIATPVIAISATDRNIDSQRRRLTGRGA